MDTPDTGTDERSAQIQAINERMDKIAAEEGSVHERRIVLRRLTNYGGDIVPFTGQHGHPELPSEAVDVLWLRQMWLEENGNPSTVTVTIEAGGDPRLAPITQGEQYMLDQYEREQEEALARHNEAVEAEKAEAAAREQQQRVDDERED